MADRFSRTIVADEVQAQAGGSYSFGPYTLEDGVYTAYVGGTGAVETKAFNVGTQAVPTAPSSSGHKGSGGVTANTGTVSGVPGGTLTLSGVTIVVPAGALDGSIQVTIDRLGETTSLPFDETLFKISDVYEIKKDRDGEFSKPVTITLPYDKSRGGSDKSKVCIYWLSEQTRSKAK